MNTISILRRADLLSIIGVSRSTIYQWMAENRFPRPVRLGKRAVGWKIEEVAEWLNARPIAHNVKKSAGAA